MEQLPVSYYHTARESEGGTRANFSLGAVPQARQSHSPHYHYSLFCGQSRPHLKRIWANETTS